MVGYEPHSGAFYSDIGDGLSSRVDFCMVKPDNLKNGVMILKYEKWCVVYNFTSLFYEKDKALILYSKECENNDEAYTKVMKLIGKMVKKNNIEGTDRVARYYNNKQNHVYEQPSFVKNEMLMNPVYKTMKRLKSIYFKGSDR